MQTEQRTTLEELRQLKQWVAWEYRTRSSSKKPQKVPIDPHTWGDASTTDPSTWGTYDEAISAASLDENGFPRIGFVFTSEDEYCGIDFDNCIDPETAEVEPGVAEIVELLDSYTEISPSGEGLKVWVRASKSGDRCRTGNIEIYDSGRFFTFTNRQYGEKGIESRQDELEELYSRLFGEPKEEFQVESRDGQGYTGDDQQLLLKMRNSGNYELFRRLYDVGSCQGFKSQSEADMSLLGMLAYWTGRDAERMESLFVRSSLARTLDRKSDKDGYLERSISVAIKNCRNTYDPDYGKKSRPRVRELLEPCIRFAVEESWHGRGADNDRAVYKELINTGLEYGKVREDGNVEVSASLRDLALAAGIGDKKTAAKALKRLESQRELIQKVKDGGHKRAATYLIKGCANLTHKTTCKYYGVPLRTSHKVRNPSPNIGTITKRGAEILVFVHVQGRRVVTEEEIAKHLGARARDIRTRNLPTLVGLGLMVEKDGGYVTPEDIEERLVEELESSGSLKAERLQRETYQREREAYEYHRNGIAPKVVPNKPVSIKEEPVMKRNLPEKNEEQIYDHGTLCGCWMCEEDSPEYVPVADEERITA